MVKIIMTLLTVVLLFAGCEPINDPEDYVDTDRSPLIQVEKDEPAMTIFNDSILSIRVVYILDGDPDDIIEVTIEPEDFYEIEDGVTEITITGGSF